MRRRSIVRTGVSSITLAALRRLAILTGVSMSLPRAHATPQPGPLEAAADALAVNKIKTLQFIASGTNFTVGQNFTPDDPWPPVRVKSYKVLINYEAGSMRQELVREMGPTMPRGGGVPFTGELSADKFVALALAACQANEHRRPYE